MLQKSELSVETLQVLATLAVAAHFHFSRDSVLDILHGVYCWQYGRGRYVRGFTRRPSGGHGGQVR